MSEPESAFPIVYRTMRELAHDERPRERLLRHGAATLSDAELLAILIGSGIAGENVLDLARRLLDSAGGLGGLLRLDPPALQRTRGLGPARTALIAAAVELGRRAGAADPESRPLLASPEQVYAFLAPRLQGLPSEQLWTLPVDVRGRLLGSGVAIEGGISAVTASAADVFREAIVLRASAVILAHNHPSGDPRPSSQDVAITRRLAEGARLLDMEIYDHVIIGHEGFVSLERDGYRSIAPPGRIARKSLT